MLMKKKKHVNGVYVSPNQKHNKSYVTYQVLFRNGIYYGFQFEVV